MGRVLMRNRSRRFVPATPLGCMQLLERSGVAVTGKTAVVVGDSNVVGTPLAVLLRDRGAAAVTVCHRLSYQEWFEDTPAVQQRRAQAAVCLPRLPGPAGGPPPGAHPDGAASAPVAHPVAPPPLFQAHQLPDVTRTADILVVAVGHPELVRADWVKARLLLARILVLALWGGPRSGGGQPLSLIHI